MGLHYILQHLDRPGTYVRILFVDFSSAFNTIISSLLQPKLTIRPHLCLSVDHQLPDRQAAASEAGKILIQHPSDQHWSSSGLRSLPTALLPLHQWFSTFFSTGPHYGPSASLTGRTHVIYILRHQYKPTRFIILFIA